MTHNQRSYIAPRPLPSASGRVSSGEPKSMTMYISVVSMPYSLYTGFMGLRSICAVFDTGSDSRTNRTCRAASRWECDPTLDS